MGRAVVTVKPTVTGTAALPAMRSADAIVNDRPVTWVNIPPDDTAVEAATSVDVCTVTATAPAVTAPMVKPLIVTEKLAAAGIAAAPVVKTTEVAPVAPHVPVRAATLLLPADIAVGITPVAKNAVGNETVTVPALGIAVTGVKLSVTGTAALPAMRSFEEIENSTEFTCPIMAPD